MSSKKQKKYLSDAGSPMPDVMSHLILATCYLILKLSTLNFKLSTYDK